MLGLIAEYDALRDTEGPFHGDQHNAQSPVAFAAALALKEYLTDKQVPATIRIFGTPAEEVGPPAKKILRDRFGLSRCRDRFLGYPRPAEGRLCRDRDHKTVWRAHPHRLATVKLGKRRSHLGRAL